MNSKMNNKDVSNIIRIQGTNDNSILSKCSMIKYGYFNDDFLPHMIGKFSRRAPLINRGYYIRAKAIEFVLLSFIEHCDKQPFQIVSLGAGFDTSFFRLTQQGKLTNCTFIEIDYFDVAHRKATLMKQEPRLWNCLSNPECVMLKQDSYIFIDAPNYKLIGIDLTKLDVLDACFRASGASYTVPTLFLSECVLTYISTKNSTNLLRFLARSFPDNAFVLYEQIHPDDSFGRFMCNHFKQLGSSLRGIATYKNQGDQMNRFLNAGWDRVSGCDMAQFYYGITDSKEKRRVESLEVFDEYEEWLLKCSHYMMLVAVKGLTWSPGLGDASVTAAEHVLAGEQDIARTIMSGTTLWLEMRPYEILQHESSGPELHKTGGIKTHYARAALVETEGGREFLLRASGYGQNPFSTGHCRLSSVSLLDLAHGGRMTHLVPARHEMLLHSLCGSMVQLAKDIFLFFGGRSSPLKPNNYATVLRLQFDETEQRWRAECDQLAITDSTEPPSPRWRHLAAVYWIYNRTNMLVYGGRNADPFPLSDLHILDWNTCVWYRPPPAPVQEGEEPGPLCSADVVSLGNGTCTNTSLDQCCGCCCVLTFGGMSGGDLLPSNTLWRWCGRAHAWTRIRAQGIERLVPRFSHSLHLISEPGCRLRRGGDNVITVVSVGGVSHECPSCPVTVIAIDITANAVVRARNYPIEVAVPSECSDERVGTEPECVMLHNHGSAFSRRDKQVWVVGGGGNCFSFGTQLNENIYSIDLSAESLLL